MGSFSNSRILGSLKQWVPIAIENLIKTNQLLVRHRSCYTNVYHCSVYRTGSQWLGLILSDWRVYRYSGLPYEFYYNRIFGTADYPDRTVIHKFPYPEPFPERRIVSIYTSFDGFTLVPKPETHKTFFVFRDPRDIVVSHYFASRRDAQRMNSPDYEILADPNDGIAYMMDKLQNMGLFSALRSWVSIPDDDSRVLCLRFEELISSRQFDQFKRLFTHCDIDMPDNVLQGLLKDNNFEALSGGRQPGQENAASHYRKGVVGDWENHLTDMHVEKFKTLTGDLVEHTGYNW